MQNWSDKVIDQDYCKKFTGIKIARNKTALGKFEMRKDHTGIKIARNKMTFGEVKMSKDHTGMKKARKKTMFEIVQKKTTPCSIMTQFRVSAIAISWSALVS